MSSLFDLTAEKLSTMLPQECMENIAKQYIAKQCIENPDKILDFIRPKHFILITIKKRINEDNEGVLQFITFGKSSCEFAKKSVEFRNAFVETFENYLKNLPKINYSDEYICEIQKNLEKYKNGTATCREIKSLLRIMNGDFDHMTIKRHYLEPYVRRHKNPEYHSPVFDKNYYSSEGGETDQEYENFKYSDDEISNDEIPQDEMQDL